MMPRSHQVWGAVRAAASVEQSRSLQFSVGMWAGLQLLNKLPVA